jgi:hypothetical protein
LQQRLQLVLVHVWREVCDVQVRRVHVLLHHGRETLHLLN